jgi:RNA ligase (TIGR02306 family)
MERKLATIRKISQILPIDGADVIELAIVDGWKVVVAKEVGHQPGDMVVYCEVDSFLPIKPQYEFLRKSSYKKMGDVEGFRLKTIKLRNQISQGLVLPLKDTLLSNVTEGMDVTKDLGIVKYEPPIPANLAGKIKGLFPSFIPKTNEERIQNLTNEFDSWKNSVFYVTEKLDGSSATFYIKDGVFGVCSRNLELLESDDNTFWKVAKYLNLEENMKKIGINFSIQGELIGEGIQGNPYKIKGQTVKIFNGFDIDKYEYMTLPTLMYLTEKLNLQMVPVLSDDFKLLNTIDEMIKFADGKSVLNSVFDREGIVVRSFDKSISFKVISNKFLLNEK